MRKAMTGTIVVKLSDGEEMVVDSSPPAGPVDPRERPIGTRMPALDDVDALRKGRPS